MALQSGNLTVDTTARKVFLDDQEVRLSDTEYNLLTALMERQGQVVERQWLYEQVVGGDTIRLVDINVKWIREKIEGDVRRISVIRGVGYRFDG
ncbi:MAG: winged helix-turn-helix domain-containing protein [Anaerolineae bacterium]|nr:winged helix-turn-helix domain-containing protein [Anaerolineae bacterium]